MFILWLAGKMLKKQLSLIFEEIISRTCDNRIDDVSKTNQKTQRRISFIQVLNSQDRSHKHNSKGCTKSYKAKKKKKKRKKRIYLWCGPKVGTLKENTEHG